MVRLRSPVQFWKMAQKNKTRTKKMTKIKINLQDLIPGEINQVVAKIENAGFEAYLVGGCVRDMLMNVSPKD